MSFFFLSATLEAVLYYTSWWDTWESCQPCRHSCCSSQPVWGSVHSCPDTSAISKGRKCPRNGFNFTQRWKSSSYSWPAVHLALNISHQKIDSLQREPTMEESSMRKSIIQRSSEQTLDLTSLTSNWCPPITRDQKNPFFIFWYWTLGIARMMNDHHHHYHIVGFLAVHRPWQVTLSLTYSLITFDFWH